MRVNSIGQIYEAYKSSAAMPNKKVEFPNVAKDFGMIQKKLAEIPDVREDKINQLKEQMKSGTYNVDSKEVANKIMSQLDIKG